MVQRPQPPSQLLKLATSLLAGLAVFAALLVGGWQLVRHDSGSIASTVDIEGPLQRVSAAEVLEAVQPVLDQSFGTLDLNQIRVEVERLPWVSRARVERQWPAAVRVRIWERTAAARWGEHALLDSDARAFSPSAESVPEGLPQLRAPEGHEREVLDAYAQFKAELLGSAFEPVALTLDARGEWLASGPQGIEMRLGRNPPHEHAALIRGALSRALESSFAQVRYVDLRYTNGFSVGWAPAHAAPSKDEGAGNG